MAMKPTEFYSVQLKKKVMIPTANIKEVTRSGRRFAVGKMKYKGKDIECWKVLPKKK